MSTRWSLALAAWLGCGDATNPDACVRGAGWSPEPAVLGGAIQETAVVALDGKVYVLGGFNAALQVVPAVRIYDVATCTWSDGPPLPRAVHHANAAVADGTLYVVGAMEGANFV